MRLLWQLAASVASPQVVGRLAVSSGLRYSCLVYVCLKDWTVAAGWFLVSACLEDGSGPAQSLVAI